MTRRKLETYRAPAAPYNVHAQTLLDMIDEYRAGLTPEEDAATLSALIGLLHHARQTIVRPTRHIQRSARRRPAPADHLNDA